MGRKTTIWILQVTNWGDCIQDDLEMSKKGKLQDRNWMSKSQHKIMLWSLIISKQKFIISYRIANVDRDESVNHMISECNKLPQMEFKANLDWLEKWSTGNCARDWNLTIQTNSINTSQNSSLKMGLIKFSVNLRYKPSWDIKSRLVGQT